MKKVTIVKGRAFPRSPLAIRYRWLIKKFRRHPLLFFNNTGSISDRDCCRSFCHYGYGVING